MPRFVFYDEQPPAKRSKPTPWRSAAEIRLRLSMIRLRLKLLRLAFNLAQPRVPAGRPSGGQWTLVGGGGGGSDRPGDSMRSAPERVSQSNRIAPLRRATSSDNADQLERDLGFSTDGPSENDHAINNPFSAFTAYQDAAQARTDAEVRVPPTGHPERDGHDDARDAFRHAVWSLRMTRHLGANKAKDFGDAHERNDPNQTRGERLMDLINNHIGRSLANQPGLPPDVVARALKEGKLQTRPVDIK